MQQIVVLSGKGGTGKTAVTAALAHQAFADPGLSGAVIVDADVDAANLEIVVGSNRLEEHRFTGGEVASIEEESCLDCGICAEICRFDAITFSRGSGFRIDPLTCEGCAACFYQCPVEAIRMVPTEAGVWFQSESRFGPLLHARLRPAQENSGKLVGLLREVAAKVTEQRHHPLLLVDGPPGIACPAIAAATGVDLALIIAEPTVAGLHDLERATQMAAHFRLRTLVCVNKADLHPEGTKLIEEACEGWGIRTVGSIPFDEAVTKAMMEGKPVTEYRPESLASRSLIQLWEEIKEACGDVERNQAQAGNVQ